MMNDKNRINCEIAEDLIPLYIDNALSKSSVEVLEEHLAGCDNCSSKVRLLLRFLPHLHLKSMDLCLMHSGA